MELARWEPFDGLNSFQSRINELFDETFGRPRMAPTGTTCVWYPAVDILESKDSYLIRAELPGMKKEEVKLEVQEGALTLSGERKLEEPADGVEYHRVERVAGKFSRSFYLPQTIKQDGNEETRRKQRGIGSNRSSNRSKLRGINPIEIKATFRDGILEVHVPKADEAKPRQIAISVN